MNIWFTADLHFGHGNIIKYCNRPFYTLDEMNTVLIRNWNSSVKKEDLVIHNGDFCFKNSPGGKIGEGTSTPSAYWEKQLNGKIIFIKGNHDKNNSCKTPITNMVISMGGKRIFIIHNPEHVGFISSCDLAFTGHVHNAWKMKRIKRQFDFIDCINIGVDVWEFKPVSINEILARYNRWEKKDI